MGFRERLVDYPKELLPSLLWGFVTDALFFISETNFVHNKLRVPAYKHYNDRLVEWMYAHYHAIIDAIDSSASPGECVENGPIWVMWLQGEAEAPEIVQVCLESIRRNSAGHEVVLLTSDNLKDHLSQPKWIVEKFEKGLITRTHYSDIVRAGLLAEHGGLWMDSTLFLHRDIPEWVFRLPFFSARRPEEDTYYRYPQPVWTGFFMGSYKGSPFMTALRDVLYEHWSKFDSIPSYFMIDYVLAAMRRHSSQFDSAIKDIPYNNQKITRLMNIINEPYDGTRLLEYANEENFASKLSYKRPAREKIYGKQTFYGYLKSIGMNG